MNSLRIRPAPLLALVFLVPLLGGCPEEQESAKCEHCGVIESITPRVVPGKPSAGSAIAGAIVGGVIGHQFGSGSGKKAATAAGAVGGAIVGSELERRHETYTVYDLVIRMEQGGVRRLTVASREGLHEGAKVEVLGDRVVPA